jgi:Recombination directionality factor-like
MIRGGLIYPQLQRLGKISIGERGEVKTSSKGNTFQAPKKLDFFTIRTHYRTEKGQLAIDTALMARLGKEPRELKIRLPFNDLEKNFHCELRYYKGGKIYCSGDGEQATRREETVVQGKTVYGEAKPFGPCGRNCPDFQNRSCKRFGALRVILEEQQQVGGVYEYRTTSRHSIENILSGLMTIQLQTGGVLAWLPLTMRLVPQTVMTPDNQAMRAYIIQIVFSGSPQQLLETVRDILATRAPLLSEIKALEAGIPMIEDDALEAKDTQDEFYPEQSSAMLRDEQAPEPTRPEGDPPPETDEIFRAIVATLEHHRPYTGRHPGAYTTFMPNESMQIIRQVFSVPTLRDLKGLPLDRLQQGYEALLAQVVPADGDEDLDILDAEFIEEATSLDGAVNAEDDVPLTPGPDAPETAQVESSTPNETTESHDAEAFTTEAADGIQDDMVDVDADDIPRIEVDADGCIIQALSDALHRRAAQYGHEPLLRQILGSATRMKPAIFRYAWVQVATKKGAKV